MTFSFRQRPLLAGAVLALAVSFVPLAAQQAPQTERVDLNAVYKIREEGFQRSRVMEIMSWLTDVYGPRLTNSPGFRKAGDWAVKEMTSWGLVNVKLQPFGPFGRGWTNDKFYMMATTPGGSLPVIGNPQAWTSSTNGLVSGDAIFATIDSPEDIATWKGKLKGKFLLSTAMPDVPAIFDPLAQRYTADQLRDLESDADARGRGRLGGPGRGGFPGGRGAAGFTQTRAQFLKDEGVLAIVSPSHAALAARCSCRVAAHAKSGPRDSVPAVSIAVEHYGRILRTLQKDQPVRIDLEVKNTFYDDPMSFNVIGEIAGTDKADEVVMLGAHFDSWHAGTGATDNAAGSAVMMEAMRILKQSGPAAPSHSSHRPVGRRGAGPHRIAAIRHRDVRRSRDDGRQAGAREVRRLLQRRQWYRRDSRRLPAGKRDGGADLRGVDEAVQQPWHDVAHDSQHGRHRSPGV